MCRKVLSEGKWTGKYHYSLRDDFPSMPLTTPPAFYQLVQGCLEHRPGKRPTASQVVSVLDSMLAICLTRVADLNTLKRTDP